MGVNAAIPSEIAADQPQLAAIALSKRFGGVRAVEDVTIAVRNREIVSIIGPNGAGKTSLLNMISGFYRPNGGSIVFEDRDITNARPSQIARLGIARTFQNIALFRGLTVLDNIMLGRHVHMRSGAFASLLYWGPAQKEEAQHRARVEELIEFLKLQDVRKQPTGALPYGLRKRVELGRALALDPKVMLLDEPSMGLAPVIVQEVFRTIQRLKQDGMTMLLVEQFAKTALTVSDYAYVMERGRIAIEGPPAELHKNERVLAAYLG